LAAGLCPDPLGELKRSPRPPSRNKGCLLLREGRGGMGKRRGGQGKGGEGRGGEGRGGPYHFQKRSGAFAPAACSSLGDLSRTQYEK